MPRFLAWLGYAAGAAWLFRRLRRRPATVADPAGELRRRLDESRAGEQPPPAGSEPHAAEPPPEPRPVGLDERRREVHDRGRAALDEMRGHGGERE